jgi:hypothetical protein
MQEKAAMEDAWIAGGVRLIKMMVELHRRGLQLLRIFPYEYPLAWRLRIAPKSFFSSRNAPTSIRRILEITILKMQRIRLQMD